jgi:hypothetical protein
MRGTEIFRNALRGLSDDFDAADERAPQGFVSEEALVGKLSASRDR